MLSRVSPVFLLDRPQPNLAGKYHASKKATNTCSGIFSTVASSRGEVVTFVFPVSTMLAIVVTTWIVTLSPRGWFWQLKFWYTLCHHRFHDFLLFGLWDDNFKTFPLQKVSDRWFFWKWKSGYAEIHTENMMSRNMCVYHETMMAGVQQTLNLRAFWKLVPGLTRVFSPQNTSSR